MAYLERQPQSDWRNGGNKSQRNQAVNNSQENLSDLSYKCRYLLNKADALYSKGDFENALVLYHKGNRLRPKAPEFRLGIAKTEDALKVLFAEGKKNEQKPEKQERHEPAKDIKLHVRKDEKEQKPVPKQEKQKNEESPKDVKKDKPEKTEDKDKSTKQTTNDKEHDEKGSSKGKDQGNKTEKSEESKAKEKTIMNPQNRFLTDEQKENIKASLAERKERIREARLQFAIREREEARKIRAKYTGRPSGHLADDMEFLRMIYKNLKSNTVPNKKVQKMTKEAMGYIDTRNNFWNHQMPHHIREKSHMIQLPKGKTPPPTQAMFAFVIKETMRINGMMEKCQWHRSIETSKKLIEHIGKMERKIPNRERIIANIFSIMGNAYIELSDDKKALKYHMKDLQLSSEFDLDDGKSRALDNVGRVYVRLGEYDKAAAVWEQKMSSDFETTPGERAWIYHEMGYCYMEIDQPEKAKESGDKSFEAAKEKGDLKWQLNASLLVAQSLLRCGEAFQSRDQFELCKKFAREMNDTEAEEKINSALTEINDVLAEWDYDDDGDFNEETNENNENDDEPDIPEEDNDTEHTSHLPVQQESHHQNNSAKSSKSMTKHTDQADMLLVSEEHKQLDAQGSDENNGDNSGEEIKEELITKVDDPQPVEAIYLGTVKDDNVKTDKTANNNNNRDRQNKGKNVGANNSKTRGNTKYTKPEPSKQGSVRDTKPKDNNRQKEPVKTTKTKDNNAISKQTESPNPKPAEPYKKPKREKSNVSVSTDKPKREKSNASLATSKPKRENSNASIITAKPSRQNSNASMRPQKTTREPSLSKPPKREPSNQSMRGRLSREGSNVSRLTNVSKTVKDPPEETHMPRITKHEDAAVIYMGRSRESSTVSKKAAGKAPHDTAASHEQLSRKPTKAELQHHDKAIDLVAEMNDPQKTFIDEENDDDEVGGGKTPVT